jgi:hypothetical protein
MSRPRTLSHLHILATALVVAALVASFCAPAEAGRARRCPRARATPATQAAPSATAAAPAVATTPAAAGIVVGIDPETGRLGMPTAAQMLELSAAERTGLLRTSEGLTEVQLPDGSWMVDLQGRFQVFSVVRLDPRSGRVFTCVDEEKALARALVAPVPSPALEER